jgi:hypothetical protein
MHLRVALADLINPAGLAAEVPQLAGTPGPRILAGSDTGALFAAGLAASGQVPGLDAFILAGLPIAEADDSAGSWDQELDLRTACPRPPRPAVRSGPAPGRALRAGP